MTLDAHTHFELVKSNSNFVFYQININQSEFTYWKVEICKKNKRKWIYEIVTSVFDTHPPYTYVTISSSKEIMFWNRYPPTFWPNVTKYAVFFFEGFPNMIISSNTPTPSVFVFPHLIPICLCFSWKYLLSSAICR